MLLDRFDLLLEIENRRRRGRGAADAHRRPAAPPDKSLPALAALAPAPIVVHSVVLDRETGGSIPQHQSRFWTLQRSGANVEMRGGCWLACTLITSYIPKERLCFAPGAFLAFHAATSTAAPPHQIAPYATLQMYQSYPVEVQQWIDRHGGYEKLTVESYWTMYDRDLWAMGYPKCR